jgi:hypothetical protein
MPHDHAVLQRTLAQIEAALADAPRPSNDDLLHERCCDDNDIAHLYPVAHWREIPDDLVESEYAALSFLSAEGFRHFVAAYMGFTLRNLASGAAAVDSTIWSLAPVFYADAGVRDFVVSKFASLSKSQCAAVVAFLDAVRELGDDYGVEHADRALSYWRSLPQAAG